MWREHWLPLLILVVPINWVVYQSDADNVVPFLILPLVALVIGIVLRPRHVWLVWLGSVVIEWIVVGYMGKYNDPGDETVGSIMIEAFVYMFIGVLVPVWFGRLIRAAIEQRRHPDQISGA
jgi:hypothetical protein